MSLKLDEEKGLFFLSCTGGPAHTYSSTAVVAMAKSGKKKSRKRKPKSQLSEVQHEFQVGIPDYDRFKLELPSSINWIKFLPKLRERAEWQLHDLVPETLDLIHKTYTNLIDLRSTIHIFSTSNLL
ncbi:unnamed protein product [Ambrosiozyma monospora]|uniref:Unnamed protein product n=1 Tax=Ambrosiozyma monospora TaxID=43982 RepID=A0ACB5T5U2_AMBMO|nr:unnamed protein product [Ambrosiozyma monospora]